MKTERVALFGDDAIDQDQMKVRMRIECGAKTMDEDDTASL